MSATASFHVKPRDSRQTTDPDRPRPVPSQQPYTILLVEDQKGIRDLIRQTLLEHGYTVLFAADGDTALRICQQHVGGLHLLVADVVMPGMSGIQLASRVRALRPNVEVLFISGLVPETMVQSQLSAGAGFLAKPFSSTQLLAKVQELLGPPSYEG